MSFAIDLDAERREVQYPNGIPVQLRGEQFIFPAEVPADALDPLFSPELDLMGILGDIVNVQGTTTTGEIIDLLFRRPSLPMRFVAAVKDIYRALLGDDAFAAFASARPSIGDYVRLSKRLVAIYGVDLGKLYSSAGSSASGGPTSNPTSPDITSSTPEASGSAPDSRGSSASAD
ncbi:hypothetical protein EF903_01695 [Streptomyces sp. WAC05292]|uniref:hypothetical protein n=1 Tax=Streptomyces sp. WAC05292 TaxID=2487418 RepID=UPI000F7457C4|nr:hypothetical protein [Streptomyces sp. WAC05292]RSS97260.1 hypothetical protein EF903_01695 [Streptomyces sp. WAC05292]